MHFLFLKAFTLSVGLILLAPVNVISQNERADTTGFMEDVKDFSRKENIFSKLLKNIFVFEKLNGENEKDINSLTKFNGKIIRKIKIKVLNVFGEELTDTAQAPRGWIRQTANSVHYKTRVWRIENQSLLSRGQKFSSFNATETERLIREFDFIYDAKVMPQGVSKDSVDVTILVKDVWSISGSAAYNTQNKSGALFLKDNNFIGLGSKLSYKLKFGDHLPKGWNWDAEFIMKNINRTFFTGKVYHQTYNEDRFYGFSYNRDFYSSVTRWGGGIEINWVNIHPVLIAGTVNYRSEIFLNNQDLWFGYAFDFLPFSVDRVNQNRINTAFRIVSTLYTQKPQQDSLRQFQNNILYLFRLGFSERKYFKDQYIFDFGKTEDIPIGTMFEFISGIENGEFREVPYYGLRLGYSTFDKEKGFLFLGAKSGSYRSKENWENGVVAFELLYFTKLIAFGNVRWRNYFWNRYAYKFKPLTQGQLLNINGEEGLRGFTSSEFGNRKFVMNYESNIFLPFKILGFKFALVTFTDFALLSSKNTPLLKSKLNKAFGLGFRFRNEHLIFPAIQFMFGYYPNADEPGQANTRLFQQNEIYYDFPNFQFGKPEVIEF